MYQEPFLRLILQLTERLFNGSFKLLLLLFFTTDWNSGTLCSSLLSCRDMELSEGAACLFRTDAPDQHSHHNLRMCPASPV